VDIEKKSVGDFIEGFTQETAQPREECGD